MTSRSAYALAVLLGAHAGALVGYVVGRRQARQQTQEAMQGLEALMQGGQEGEPDE